jgi:hypothetical protein
MLCNKCNIEKEIIDFPLKGCICKKCKSEYQKTYKLENKEKLKQYSKNYLKKYRKENIEKIKEYNKEYNIVKDVKREYNKKYYKDNKNRKKQYDIEYKKENLLKIKEAKTKWRENNKEYQKNYMKNRILTDDIFRASTKTRSMIKNSFIRMYTKKSKSTTLILGCSFDEFKIYLESKFEEWMTWKNYGKYNGKLNYGWDIDHIIPISSATSEEDVIKLNHYTNLQPLCSYTNRYIKRNLF